MEGFLMTEIESLYTFPFELDWLPFTETELFYIGILILIILFMILLRIVVKSIKRRRRRRRKNIPPTTKSSSEIDEAHWLDNREVPFEEKTSEKESDNLMSEPVIKYEAKFDSTSLNRLPFSCGIETEILVTKEDGSWIDRVDIQNTFDKFLENMEVALESLREDSSIPDYIRDKWKGTLITKDKRKKDQEAVQILYPKGDELFYYTVAGKDSNNQSIDTYIYEIQTPPCEFTEELVWWMHNIFKMMYKSIKQIDENLLVISNAINPIMDFDSVTCGDHHHIGIKDKETKVKAFNLLRNYIPHLIALSVNSPVTGQIAPECEFYEDAIILPVNEDAFSIRLRENKAHLGRIPSLSIGDDDESYINKIGRDKSHARLVDIYPFTDVGTVEIRILDTQPSVSDRIAFNLLIQAICSKASKMKLEDIPVISDDILEINRNRALSNGLIADFQYDPNLPKSESAKAYQSGSDIAAEDAVKNMFSFLKDEIKEMGLIESKLISPLLIRAFGGDNSNTFSTITPAQYQLLFLKKCCLEDELDLEELSIAQIEQNADNLEHVLLLSVKRKKIYNNLMAHMDSISNSVASSEILNLYNPLIDEFGEPILPAFLQKSKLALELLLSSKYICKGEKVYFDILVNNYGEWDEKDIMLNYTVQDEEGVAIASDTITVENIKESEKKTFHVEFCTDMSKHYVIECWLPDCEVKARNIIETIEFDLDVQRLGKGNYIAIKKDCVDVQYKVNIKSSKEVEIDANLKVLIKEVKGDFQGSENGTIHLAGKELQIIADGNHKGITKPISIISKRGENMRCKLYAELDFNNQKFVGVSRDEFIIYGGPN